MLDRWREAETASSPKRGEAAVGPVVVDKLVQALTQALYAVFGLVLLIFVAADAGLAIGVAAFVIFLSGGLYGFYRLQRVGLFGVLLRLAGKLPARFLDTGIPCLAVIEKRWMVACLPPRGLG